MNKVGTASAFDGVHKARFKWALESTMTIAQIAAKYPVQFLGALQAFNNWGTDYSGNPNPAYYWTAAGLTGNFYAYQQYLLGNMV